MAEKTAEDYARDWYYHDDESLMRANLAETFREAMAAAEARGRAQMAAAVRAIAVEMESIEADAAKRGDPEAMRVGRRPAYGKDEDLCRVQWGRQLVAERAAKLLRNALAQAASQPKGGSDV